MSWPDAMGLVVLEGLLICVLVAVGFLSFVAIKLALGKIREIHPLVWGVSVCFLAYFAIDPLQQLLNAK